MKKKVRLPNLPKFKFKFKLNTKIGKSLMALVVLLSLFALVFNFKNLFIAAIVDGKPVSRFYVDRLLEKQGGKSVLENEIIKILIVNEAKKQKLDISNEEVDQKIQEIESQVTAGGSSLDQLLSAQGQTRESLKEQIKIQLIIEKSLSKDVAVSDEEVKAYYDKNKAYYDKTKTLVDLTPQIKEDIVTQKISEKFQPWLDELKKNAKIYYFVNW